MHKKNKTNRRFDKKIYVIAITLVCMLVLTCICIIYFVKKNDSFENNNQVYDIMYKQIEKDCFSDDTKLEQTIIQEVNIEIIKVSDNILDISIEAPNICDALIDLVKDMDENIEEDQLEKEILMLIRKTPKEANIYELYYKDVNDIEINYTEEYINAISCGLYDFYNYAMEQTILDMLKEEENE